ncbi:hypothetical protein ACFWN7_11090 [Agromyces sp. NPDC058484]|uniref:hypothetical protein n=1 Tax=Agromyces sp. NPDC058484 TaxID=3346524 RepID=UPI00364763E5
MPNEMNPFVGRPGFWNRVNRIIYPIAGPAQVGIGYGKTEAPYVPPADPACPICREPMADHIVQRGDANTPTHVICPGR